MSELDDSQHQQSDAEFEAEAAEAEEQPKEWKIDHVVILTSPTGKTWQCKTKQQDDVTYFQVSKWDRAATMALSNRGLELRSTKEAHMLNQSNFESIVAARNAKCDQLVQAYLKDAAERKGEVWNPTKPTKARAEHALLVASFIELQLPCLMGVDGPVEGFQAPCAQKYICFFEQSFEVPVVAIILSLFDQNMSCIMSSKGQVFVGREEYGAVA